MCPFEITYAADWHCRPSDRMFSFGTVFKCPMQRNGLLGTSHQPPLGGRPVGRVEPHPVALCGGLRVVVERHARRGHDGVASLAGRDAPELGGQSVRLGQDRPVARLGQQRAARGDPVEAGGGVALERERGRARGDAAPGGRGRDGHGSVHRARQPVGAVFDDPLQSCVLVFSC